VDFSFGTRCGNLAVRVDATGLYCLALPKPSVLPIEPDDDLLIALGLRSCEEMYLVPSLGMYLVVVPSPSAVAHLDPSFSVLARWRGCHHTPEGVAVTAVGDPPYDFVSRFFDPWEGLPEDTVTGSAHSALGVFWSSRLRKSSMRAAQLSRRGGSVQVRIREPAVEVSGFCRVLLAGRIVTSQKAGRRLDGIPE
jgi:predicted PhzF superfamily epimerase YddE/YHI9